MICERPLAHSLPTRPVDIGIMNSRLIISLLCAGALAFPCGPRSRSEPPSIANARTVPLTTKSPERPRRRDSENAKLVAKINSNLEVNVAQRDVHFALNVTNVGQKHVELSFPNGKSYDF